MLRAWESVTVAKPRGQAADEEGEAADGEESPQERKR
jgi:hypothetical protein